MGVMIPDNSRINDGTNNSPNKISCPEHALRFKIENQNKCWSYTCSDLLIIHTVMADIVMAYIVMACMVMACMFMAYIVMAYIVVWLVMAIRFLGSPDHCVRLRPVYRSSVRDLQRHGRGKIRWKVRWKVRWAVCRFVRRDVRGTVPPNTRWNVRRNVRSNVRWGVGAGVVVPIPLDGPFERDGHADRHHIGPGPTTKAFGYLHNTLDLDQQQNLRSIWRRHWR